MSNILIADSGGTGTDWVQIDPNGVRSYFDTESYHPNNWNDDFWRRIDNYWKAKNEFKKADVRFYGAGCYQKNRVEELEHKFREMGFLSVSVKSDLHAAGNACYHSQKGNVAILGTGSVYFKYANHQVNQIVGGKGHLLGDEGSGFYFGKLLLQKYRQNELSEEQLKVLKHECNLDQLLILDDQEIKFGWASISKMLKHHQNLFVPLHVENIHAFIDFHFSEEVPETISLVGSYAFHFKNLWESELAAIGCKVDQIVQRPIEHLID